VPRVAVVGSYGVGLTFGSARAPERGETVIGTLFRTDDGGKGSNQAVGAARLGAEVSLLTAVGEDAFGDRAHELWEREGVDACSGSHNQHDDLRSSERERAMRGRVAWPAPLRYATSSILIRRRRKMKTVTFEQYQDDTRGRGATCATWLRSKRR